MIGQPSQAQLSCVTFELGEEGADFVEQVTCRATRLLTFMPGPFKALSYLGKHLHKLFDCVGGSLHKAVVEHMNAGSKLRFLA